MYAEESLIFHVLAIFHQLLCFMRLGYLVDVNVLAFNSPGPIPERVM